MFNWFKRVKPKVNRLERNSYFAMQVRRSEKIKVLGEMIYGYLSEVRDKKIFFPAYARQYPEGFGLIPQVLEIWTDTRLEAFTELFKPYDSDPCFFAEIASDISKQLDLINIIFDKKQQFLNGEFNTHAGPLESTIQAIFKSYFYLSDAGFKVSAYGTDEKDIWWWNKESVFQVFEENVRELEKKYNNDSNLKDTLRLKSLADQQIKTGNIGNEAIQVEKTPTIFDLLFEDVTSKSKSIAFSCVFGPKPEEMLKSLAEHVKALAKSRGEVLDVNDISKGFYEVFNMDEPGEIILSNIK